MRTRGNLVAYMDGAPNPGAFVEVGVGLIVVPEGQGSTVIWSPLSDANAPWFWYSCFMIGHEEPVTDVLQHPELLTFREIVDSKAMRKAPPDTEVQIVFENATVGLAGTVNVGFCGRVLLGF